VGGFSLFFAAIDSDTDTIVAAVASCAAVDVLSDSTLGVREGKYVHEVRCCMQDRSRRKILSVCSVQRSNSPILYLPAIGNV
jgi:hypothetical protein